MRQLRSLVTDDGHIEVSVTEQPDPTPRDHEIVVKVEATPINPSDLGLLFGGADLDKLEVVEGADGPTVRAPLSAAAQSAQAARVGQSLPVGNEGAGAVIAAGSDPEAQALLGRTVTVLGREMYGEQRATPAKAALVLPEGTDARDAASCFVNPLTALAMTETMRSEGHTALVHTAAASNLGQMLQRICIDDDIALVNIVRSDAQRQLLLDLGATHVCNSADDDFDQKLITALTETGATIGFDAIGGGTMASRILTAMEAAANAGSGFSRYGSTVHKQLYIYGGLDRGTTELRRAYGTMWSVGGFLLTNFLVAASAEVGDRMRARVIDELHTTFASTYTEELTLDQMLEPETIARYTRMATGEKALVTPNG